MNEATKKRPNTYQGGFDAGYALATEHAERKAAHEALREARKALESIVAGNPTVDSPEADAALSAITARAALARIKEITGDPINWRDDPEAIVEDDEPMIGRDYA